MEFCIFLKIWIKIQTAETTGDFIANKIINKITRLSKNLQQDIYLTKDIYQVKKNKNY